MGRAISTLHNDAPRLDGLIRLHSVANGRRLERKCLQSCSQPPLLTAGGRLFTSEKKLQQRQCFVSSNATWSLHITSWQPAVSAAATSSAVQPGIPSLGQQKVFTPTFCLCSFPFLLPSALSLICTSPICSICVCRWTRTASATSTTCGSTPCPTCSGTSTRTPSRWSPEALLTSHYAPTSKCSEAPAQVPNPDCERPVCKNQVFDSPSLLPDSCCSQSGSRTSRWLNCMYLMPAALCCFVSTKSLSLLVQMATQDFLLLADQVKQQINETTLERSCKNRKTCWSWAHSWSHKVVNQSQGDI